MRCFCCHVVLTPQESVRKFKESGEYTETCNSCLKYIDVPTKEGSAFEKDEDLDDGDGGINDLYDDGPDED